MSQQKPTNTTTLRPWVKWAISSAILFALLPATYAAVCYNEHGKMFGWGLVTLKALLIGAILGAIFGIAEEINNLEVK